MLTSPPWHCWRTAGKGSMGRYLTDTWHAAEALGSEEGCVLSLLPTLVPPVLVLTDGSDLLWCALLWFTSADVQHGASLHKWAKLLGVGGLNQSSPGAHT